MLQSDRWTSDSIADVLSTDVALTTEILRLINSSMFGYSGKVNTVSRAVSLLGIDLIRTLVLGNKLFLPHDDLESWLDLGLLDRRCKSVAAGTYALALRDRASKDAASTAYLTGMVNEVGLLVMGRVPNIGATLAAPLNTRTFPDVERALFGGDRFVVGGRLLQEWGFDGEVVDGVLQMTSPDVADSTGLPWYLYAARQLVLEHGFNHQDLAAPAGAIPAIDDALDAVRNGVEVEVPEPEPVPETV
jgi:HD-like signal output (HDOD) protein